MIPVKYLEELKTAPVEEVDFVATFIEVSLRQIFDAVILLGANEPRCSRENTQPWVADQPCIRGLLKHNSTII